MSDGLHHEIIRSNGVKLHVVTDGPADGSLAILLHGFPEGWWGMRRQIAPLVQAGFRVLVPDQRGYGTSARPTNVRDYRLDALASDVLGLIDATESEKAYLVGHDWGAAVAWWTAMKAPGRVSKLVAMNVPHPLVMRKTLGESARQLARSWYAFAFQIPYLADAGLVHTQILEDFMRRSARPGTFSDEDFAMYRSQFELPGAMTAMIAWYRAAFRHPSKSPGDHRVHVPTQIIWGAKDEFVGVEMAEPSAAMCDQAQMQIFENAGHWVQHEEADAVNELIRRFFAQKDGDHGF